MRKSNTPRPWAVRTGVASIEGITHLAVVSDPTGKIVCSVSPMSSIEPVDWVHAHLISAIPEMTDLCLKLSQLNQDNPEIGAGMLKQLVADAQAILQKATVK